MVTVGEDVVSLLRLQVSAEVMKKPEVKEGRKKGHQLGGPPLLLVFYLKEHG